MQAVTPLDRFSQLRRSRDYIKWVPLVFVLIGRLLPTEVTSIHVERRLYHGGARDYRLESLSIKHVNLNATTGFAAMLLKRRHEHTRTKMGPREIQFV